MSSLASFLMVVSGAMCLTGAFAAKGRPAIVAATVMVLAMVDLAYSAHFPAVAWSGVLLLVGLFQAVFLRSQEKKSSPRRAAVLVTSGASEMLSSDDNRLRSAPVPDRCGSRVDSHSGPTAAVLSAIAYPVMAWQILNHGVHLSNAGNAGGHGHHAGDISLMSTFMTLAVAVLAVCLIVCAVHDMARRRPLISLDCWGMAAMIIVMQFLH